MRLIDADSLLAEYDRQHEGEPGKARKLIEDAPTIYRPTRSQFKRMAVQLGYEPVRHGKWVHSRYENCSEQFEIVKCSCCGHEAYAMAFYVRGGNYCPNCGAKMYGAE